MWKIYFEHIVLCVWNGTLSQKNIALVGKDYGKWPFDSRFGQEAICSSEGSVTLAEGRQQATTRRRLATLTHQSRTTRLMVPVAGGSVFAFQRAPSSSNSSFSNWCSVS